MTFSDIARWLLGRRESKPRPPRPSASFPAKGKSTRPSASFPAKGKSTRSSASFTAKEKSPGQHGSGQRAARHGRKRIGEVDKEIDGFVVLAEGGDWTSCSDSDESDWSIGWFERLSSEFSSDNESDNSFAVLVPCYGPSSRKALNYRGKQNKKTSILDMIQSNSSSKDSQKCVDKWLASLNGK